MQTFPYHVNRKNFNLSPDPQNEKSLPDKRRNYIHQNEEVKEML